MDKRVVVTGLGLVTPIGNDVPTFWSNLIHGVCGIDYITDFPTEGLAVKIGGKLKDFDPLQFGMDKPFVRKQDPFTIFARAATSTPAVSVSMSVPESAVSAPSTGKSGKCMRTLRANGFPRSSCLR